MQAEEMKDLVVHELDEMKAQDVKVLDVRGLTTIADYMVVASGTSDRHVKAISDKLVEAIKQVGQRPLGVEGEDDGQWILADFGDVIAHIMLPQVREFYKLENLWEPDQQEARDQG